MTSSAMFYGPGIGGSSSQIESTRKKVSAMINRSLSSFAHEEEFSPFDKSDKE